MKREDEEATIPRLEHHSLATTSGWAAFFFFPANSLMNFLGRDLRRNGEEGGAGGGTNAPGVKV